jgi:hypothetical protein
MQMSIYGKQWGEYPSDSELDIPEVEEELLCACGGKKHHFKHLCIDSCKETTKNVKQIEEKVSVESIVKFCINDIMEYVDEFIENEDKCYDYYYVTYGVKPQEWRDKNGKLLGVVYYSNSPETRKLWGDCLTMRRYNSDDESDSESDEEYDDGDVADYHRHKDMYNKNF